MWLDPACADFKAEPILRTDGLLSAVHLLQMEIPCGILRLRSKLIDYLLCTG
jgi:hypothetical protein